MGYNYSACMGRSAISNKPIRNYIFQPIDPVICLTDASEVEQAAIITQWDREKLNLKMVVAKSTLFTTAQRRQSPLHPESPGVNQVLQVARPYLFQSKSPVMRVQLAILAESS